MGHKNLALNDVVRMRIHGVTAQYVKELRDLGYNNVSVDDLVRMRIHGVTPEFIRDVNAAGFKNMTVADLVDFSIHGAAGSRSGVATPNRNSSAWGKSPPPRRPPSVLRRPRPSSEPACLIPDAGESLPRRRTLRTVSRFQSSRHVSAVPTPR